MASFILYDHTPRCYRFVSKTQAMICARQRRIKDFTGMRIRSAAIQRPACLFTYLSLLFYPTKATTTLAVFGYLSNPTSEGYLKSWFWARCMQENIPRIQHCLELQFRHKISHCIKTTCTDYSCFKSGTVRASNFVTDSALTPQPCYQRSEHAVHRTDVTS